MEKLRLVDLLGLEDLGLLDTAVDCVYCELRKGLTEEEAINKAVSEIQGISLIYGVDASTDKKQLLEIVTKAYEESK